VSLDVDLERYWCELRREAGEVITVEMELLPEYSVVEPAQGAEVPFRDAFSVVFDRAASERGRVQLSAVHQAGRRSCMPHDINVEFDSEQAVAVGPSDVVGKIELPCRVTLTAWHQSTEEHTDLGAGRVKVERSRAAPQVELILIE
jgi:hypothetical protein